MELKRQLGIITGIFIIVADMIGSGIFMTTGNVLGITGNALVVLVLWVVGGFIAVCGSLCYSELAVMWPQDGGEYNFLKKSFGYLPAFLSGWISLIVGFSAPVAMGSLLMAGYVGKFTSAVMGCSGPLSIVLNSTAGQKGFAIGVIVFFSIVHIIGVKKGSYFQNLLTALKIGLVLMLIIFGFAAIDWSFAGRLAAQYPDAVKDGNFSLPLAGLALLIIMFSYSGWNCATYIAGEIKNPSRNLPRILFWGTLITTVIYILLNVVFIMSDEGRALMGKDEIGAYATLALFGPAASGFFTLCIALILLSAVSVQIMVGPRVYFSMANDGMIFRWLSRIHPRFETPYLAILLQMGLSIIYVIAGTAMTLVMYMGFALSIFPVLTVIALIYMRRKEPNLERPFRVPLYPLIPLLFIILSLGTMTAALVHWTETSLFALGAVILGIPVFFLWKKFFDGETAD